MNVKSEGTVLRRLLSLFHDIRREHKADGSDPRKPEAQAEWHADVREIRQIFAIAISRETDIAIRHRADPYWSSNGHNVGEDELTALEYAREIDTDAQSDEIDNSDLYLARLLSGIAHAKTKYRSLERDPEGFGFGTLSSIEKALRDWTSKDIATTATERRLE